MEKRHLPKSVYNWVTASGAALAVVSFALIALLLAIDVLAGETSVYLGLLTFVALPSVLVVGLVLIPVGMVLAHRRQARGETTRFSRIHFDLSEPATRNATTIFVTGTAVLLVATAYGTYNAYRSTESVEFCGTLCHDVMQPEYTAYQGSPHARVACVECHIGSGADWYVKSKLSGAYQVYAVTAGVYPTPIPTPVRNLRPARETCEECHWPEKFFGGRQKLVPHFLPDEANTPYPISLLLKVGGANAQTGQVEGIHWHVARSNHIQYRAKDEAREEIAWVRLTRADGSTKEFRDPEGADAGAAAAVRTMDCIDCHNRPSHRYRSPNQTVNQAIAAGRIDRSLPYIKRRAVMALDTEYSDTTAALTGIETALRDYYRAEYADLAAQKSEAVDAAVAAVQGIYRTNFFPKMKVTWRQYPDHVGHSEYVGCFRCHGSNLQTVEGDRISSDCTLCHTILAQGGAEAVPTQLAPGGLEFAHPEDIGGAEKETRCTECHHGGAELF